MSGSARHLAETESPAGRPEWDAAVAALALTLMALIPVLEIGGRQWLGQGVDNAPVLVQHLGLWLAMFGALAAERSGHLSTLAGGLGSGMQADSSVAQAIRPSLARQRLQRLALGASAWICGVLTWASVRFVLSEADVGHLLAYGIKTWWLQLPMPLCLAWLGWRLGSRSAVGWSRSADVPGRARADAEPSFQATGQSSDRAVCAAVSALGQNATPGHSQPRRALQHALALAWPLAGVAAAAAWDGQTGPGIVWWALPLLGMLLAGAPVFAVLGGLALALFWADGLPLASVPLSHYQITVNPSLPALPLFTWAGLIFASGGGAQRLGDVFLALSGGGWRGSVVACALLCSCFTAFTGGSGVTILALGGLLLPLLRRTGYPEARGIGLVTSASALGVLLAPSVPLILYAVIARVPIETMFLAGVLPALLMVAFLLLFGGFLRRVQGQGEEQEAARVPAQGLGPALWRARWELLAPVVALGALLSGLATPTESAALTAAYAVLSQVLGHRELGGRGLLSSLVQTGQLVGGVMLILGMALALTNYLIDAGIPDAALEWVQAVIPHRWLFLLALNVFLFLAGALMEIFAAIVVLVPLLLPLAVAYGIDPVHFGIIFLANMELGFLCPPAGMNLYFAASLFRRPVGEVARAVAPALLAIFLGALSLSALPWLATGLPAWAAALKVG